MILFSHSGRYGDVIWSLVSCIERANGEPFDFHLHTNRRDDYDPSNRGVMMKPLEAEFLASILREQSYIRNLTISDKAAIPAKDVTRVIDLDRFRDVPEPYTLTEIRDWYKRIMPVTLRDKDKPWIHVPQIEQPKIDKVCICFTERYLPVIDPGVLAPLKDRLVFIGLPSEHKRFCAMYFSVDYHPVGSLKELLQYTSKSRGWCSNISGNYAAHEAAAIPRVLCLPGGLCHGDVRPTTPNGKAVLDNDKLLASVEALFSH